MSSHAVAGLCTSQAVAEEHNLAPPDEDRHWGDCVCACVSLCAWLSESFIDLISSKHHPSSLFFWGGGRGNHIAFWRTNLVRRYVLLPAGNGGLSFILRKKERIAAQSK